MPFTGIPGTILSMPGNFELAFVPAQDVSWFKRPAQTTPETVDDDQKKSRWLPTLSRTGETPWLRKRTEETPPALQDEVKRSWVWLTGPINPVSVSNPWFVRRPAIAEEHPEEPPKKKWSTGLSQESFAWIRKPIQVPEPEQVQEVRRTWPWLGPTHSVSDSIPWFVRKLSTEEVSEEIVKRKWTPSVTGPDNLAWARRRQPAEESEPVQEVRRTWPWLTGQTVTTLDISWFVRKRAIEEQFPIDERRKIFPWLTTPTQTDTSIPWAKRAQNLHPEEVVEATRRIFPWMLSPAHQIPWLRRLHPVPEIEDLIVHRIYPWIPIISPSPPVIVPIPCPYIPSKPEGTSVLHGKPEGTVEMHGKPDQAGTTRGRPEGTPCPPLSKPDRLPVYPAKPEKC